MGKKQSVHVIEPTRLELLKKQGRAVKQEISMRHIVADSRFQCRVEMNVDNVERFQERIREGVTLDPVVLFQDNATDAYILADGFHRHKAHLKQGLRSIWAWVIKSDIAESEAMLFAASANRIHCLPTTKEDKEKAVLCLLSCPEWFAWNNAMIAREAGVCDLVVRRIRLEYCERTNQPMPTITKVTRKGVEITRPTQRAKPGDPLKVSTRMKKNGNTEFCVQFPGIRDRQYVGRTKDGIASPEIKAKIAELNLQHTQTGLRFSLANMQNFAGAMQSRRIPVASVRIFPGGNSSALSFRQSVFLPLDNISSESLFSAYGKFRLLQENGHASQRQIIVCYDSTSIAGALGSLVRNLKFHGVEFMTPEEIIADFEAQQAEDQPTES